MNRASSGTRNTLATVDAMRSIGTASYGAWGSGLPAAWTVPSDDTGVAHILEGSVQKAGESVRVNVQLIKAEGDSHLWAETYDRKLTDIFAVESEVDRGSTFRVTLPG